MATFAGFGAKTTTAAAPGATPGGAGGFSFGTTPAQPAATQPAGGLSFGTQPQATPVAAAAATPGFGLGVTPATTNKPAPALSFGTATPATATGFTLGGALGATAPKTTAAATGFALGTPSTSASAFLGGPLTSAAAATSTPAPGGFSFAKPGTVAGTAATAGFSLSKPATTAAATTTATGFGLGGTSTAGFGFATGGLGGAAATTGSIFGSTPAKTSTAGLGGVDPKTTTASSGTTGTGAKASEGKTVKETPVEKEILLDVDGLTKFVKEEKGETEQIKRMSSTPMIRVQEDNAALRQLLAVVSSGLQRNVCNVDKLKREMIQELKNAEMSIRTKEIPPGLQYENTAPTQYFHSLVEGFESQMLCYRQQIEMLENHLASLHQPSRLTAEELVLLLRKLHEAFVAMAAQLQQIHEAVKTQKEHYLNYRKVFLGDSRNIFERQKKAPVKATPVNLSETYGQSPFPGVNNAAAAAMATALTRSQQPQPQPNRSLFDTGIAGGGLGSTASQPAAFKGLFGGATSVLSSTQAGSLFSSPLSTAGAQPPQMNLSTATEQPFQLNKPPVGSKRGKR